LRLLLCRRRRTNPTTAARTASPTTSQTHGLVPDPPEPAAAALDVVPGALGTVELVVVSAGAVVAGTVAGVVGTAVTGATVVGGAVVGGGVVGGVVVAGAVVGVADVVGVVAAVAGGRTVTEVDGLDNVGTLPPEPPLEHPSAALPRATTTLPARNALNVAGVLPRGGWELPGSTSRSGKSSRSCLTKARDYRPLKIEVRAGVGVAVSSG